MDDTTEKFEETKTQQSILSQDVALKYDFMTSLQKLAMARIVSNLWMNQNTQQKLMDLYPCQQLRHTVHWRNKFHKIEHDIIVKISQLSLPNSICEELNNLVTILGKSLVNWITYHDKDIFRPEESGYFAVDWIYNIKWTARGKIDYLQTTKSILANPNISLSDILKYKLACTYCLEDEIASLFSKLVNKFYLSYITIDKQPMVYFWTTHVTDQMTQLNIPPYCSGINRCDRDMSINEHILQLLITNNRTMNDVPIRFMWNKLCEEEKARNIELLFKGVRIPDFIISSLSSLDYKQQQNILKECSYAVLNGILKDWWWWGNYFLPTVRNVLHIMNPPTFWKVLFEINRTKSSSYQKKEYDQFKSLFKLLWQEGSTEFKEFIFLNELKSLEIFVINELNWEQDMDVIDVIFKGLNIQGKKNIAFSNDGIRRCGHFIELGKWDLLDVFIKCTLFSEDDLRQLKQRVIQDSGRETAKYFLEQRDFHEFQRFMNWAFESDEEINNFCQSLSVTLPSS